MLRASFLFISSPDLFRTEFLYERVLMGALLFFLLFYIAMSVSMGAQFVCVCVCAKAVDSVETETNGFQK